MVANCLISSSLFSAPNSLATAWLLCSFIFSFPHTGRSNSLQHRKEKGYYFFFFCNALKYIFDIIYLSAKFFNLCIFLCFSLQREELLFSGHWNISSLPCCCSLFPWVSVFVTEAWSLRFSLKVSFLLFGVYFLFPFVSAPPSCFRTLFQWWIHRRAC